jgi:hypothetical protein
VVGILVFYGLFLHVVKSALRNGRKGTKSQFITMTVLKILAVFLFSTSLLASYQLDWGAPLLFVFGLGGAAATSDASSIALSGCIGLTLHNKMRVVAAVPFVVFLLPLPALAWRKYKSKRNLWGAPLHVAYRTSVLIGLWQIHPAILHECVLALLTKRVGERDFVAADMGVSTDDAEYATTRAIAITLMVTFVPLLPVYVFGTMWRRSAELDTLRAQLEADKGFAQQFFYFYGAYKPQYYGWEAANFVMKALLAVISSYASVAAEENQGVLVFAATWVVLVAALLEYKYEAYRRRVEEQLVKFTLFALLSLMLSTLGMIAASHNPGCRTFIRVLAAVIVMGTMLVFVTIFMQQCCAQLRERASQRRSEGDEPAGTEATAATEAKRENFLWTALFSRAERESTSFTTNPMMRKGAQGPHKPVPMVRDGAKRSIDLPRGHNPLAQSVLSIHKKKKSTFFGAVEFGTEL